MKNQFEKKTLTWRRGHRADEYVYVHVGPFYHRHVRTFPEIRRNCADVNEYRETKMRGIRPCRGNVYLNAWNDWNVSRNYGKSWKDFTKNRKQWMDTGEVVPDKRD